MSKIVQLKYKNDSEIESLFPKTTIEAVVGLENALNSIEGTIGAKPSYTEYLEGNTSGTAGTWTATSEYITKYEHGMTVLFKIGIAGASNTYLNINDLGPVQVYRMAGTKLTTQYPVNSVILLAYDENANGGCFYTLGDYDANNYDRMYSNNAIEISHDTLYRYKLIGQTVLGTFAPMFITNKTSTTKVTPYEVSSQEFLIGGRIEQYNATTIVNVGSTVTNKYSELSNNYIITYNLNETSGTLEAFKFVYLVGTLGPNGGFKLDSTNFWTQNLPNTKDGKLYMLLGYQYNATTGTRLYSDHPVFYYDGGIKKFDSDLSNFVKSDNLSLVATTGHFSDLASAPAPMTLNQAKAGSETTQHLIQPNILKEAIIHHSPSTDVSGLVTLNTSQKITNSKTFEGTAITLYSRRLNNNAGIYAGMMMERDTTSLGTTAPATFGIGGYFKAKSTSGVMTHAGLFGGRLVPSVDGESSSQIGEVVFSPAWENNDPYTRTDFRIRAISTSKANVYLTGDMYVGSSGTGKDGKKLSTEEFVTSSISELTASDVGGMSIDHPSFSITETQIGNWDTAHGWGDHSTQGYVKSSGVTSVNLASGTNNGTLKLTVNGSSTDNIAVKGLGSAAYTASTAYRSSTWTPAIEDLPTGTTSETVALGNHTHGNATTSDPGFMSATDKERLDTIHGLWGEGGSQYVDRIQEVLTVFADFPESTTLLSAFAEKANDDEVVKLAGTQTITGAKTITNNSGLKIYSSTTNQDFTALRLGDRDNGYGFDFKYLGTGTGDNNLLELWADNATGTPQKVFGVKQDGVLIFDTHPYISTSKIATEDFVTGKGYITSSGNITGSAATLTTARTITIGSTGKTFNGSSNVSWTLSEIGAASESHNHSGVYEPVISKNTAFNKNFAGSGSATTVARSDHNHNDTYLKLDGLSNMTGPLQMNSKIKMEYNGVDDSIDFVFL